MNLLNWLVPAYGTALTLAVMSPVIVTETMGLAFFNRYGLAVFLGGMAVIGSPLLVVPYLDARGREYSLQQSVLRHSNKLDDYYQC